MKRIENRENNDCWESQVFAGIKVGALRKEVEDMLWLMIMLWEPENCVMLVLKLAEREQGHLGTNSPGAEFARSHSDFSWFSVCSQLCAFAPCALGSSRSWKILCEKLYKYKRNKEFGKLLPSQRNKTDLFLFRERNCCVWHGSLWKCVFMQYAVYAIPKTCLFCSQITEHVSLFCVTNRICALLCLKKELTPKKKTGELNIKKMEVSKLRDVGIIRSILLPTGT